MLIVHTSKTSGINPLYPSIYEGKKSRRLTIIEIERYKKSIKYLFLLDSLLFIFSSLSFFGVSWWFSVLIGLITCVSFPIRSLLLPSVEIAVSSELKITIAPAEIIFENVFYFSALALAGISAFEHVTGVFKIIGIIFIPVSVLFILLPFINIVAAQIKHSLK